VILGVHGPGTDGSRSHRFQPARHHTDATNTFVLDTEILQNYPEEWGTEENDCRSVTR